jgi:hypothetical protein
VNPWPALKLGANERYRPALELAAARTGLDPALLAAIVDAEAAPLRSAVRLARLADEAFYRAHPERAGQPLDPKNPQHAALVREWKAIRDSLKGSWDERSSAGALSSARGATQFLARTWVDEAERPGTYLNQVARQKGYLDHEGRLVPARRRALLDLRYDRTLAVVGAAEYDQHEFDRLVAAGAIPAAVTDVERAHYLYLCHHEGFAGAQAILSATLSDAAAAPLLQIHVRDRATREALVREHGGESAAYQAYLWDYIEDRVQPDRYRA